jgi:hypothetical protein
MAQPDILVIADDETELPGKIVQVRWNRVPEDIPDPSDFDAIFVIPGENSGQKQDSLIEILTNCHKLFKRHFPPVTWVLNSHSTGAAVQGLSAGSIVALHAKGRGKIISLLSGAHYPLEHLAFAFTEVGDRAMPFATWEKPGGKAKATVGIITVDGRWTFTPPPSAFSLLPRMTSYLRFMRQLVPVFAVAAVMLCLLLGILATRRQRGVYRAEISALAHRVSPLLMAVTRARNENSKTWGGGGRRLADRVLTSHIGRLLILAHQLDKEKTPAQLWRLERDRSTSADNFFYLSLITGDLASAYNILKEMPIKFADGEKWLQILTSTFWQASLESLHELNFERAESYDSLYLVLSYRILTDPSYDGSLDPERNRTLAQILRRELKTERIKMLCLRPGVEGSFGRLLGGVWGEALPAGPLGDLAERRRHFADLFCGRLNRQVTANYDILRTLEKERTLSSADEACRLAELECEYKSLANRMEPGGVIDQHLVAETLRFSSSCSYLADDLLATLLDRLLDVQANKRANPRRWLDVQQLSLALSCHVGDDNRQRLEHLLGKISCGWLARVGMGSSWVSESQTAATLVRRCGGQDTIQIERTDDIREEK